MPLTTCPDCQHPVSDAAPACPHCGKPSARAVVAGKVKTSSRVMIVLGTGLVLGGTLALILGGVVPGISAMGVTAMVVGFVLFIAGRLVS